MGVHLTLYEKFPLVYESDNIGDSPYEKHGATLKHKCGTSMPLLPSFFHHFLFFFIFFFSFFSFGPESHLDLCGNHSLHHPFLTREMLGTIEASKLQKIKWVCI